MNSMKMAVAKSMAQNTFSNAKNSVMGKETGEATAGAGAVPGINWNDFNYPPLLKIVHFNVMELQDPQKAIVKKMHWAFRILLIILVLNFINSVAQTIADSDNAMKIMFSVLNFFLFPAFALYSMYKGYRGITFDSSNLKLYMITQVMLIILYFTFTIISAGCFNGWTRVGQLFGGGHIFQGIVGIIESLLYTFNFLFMAFTLFVVHRFTNGGATTGSKGASSAPPPQVSRA